MIEKVLEIKSFRTRWLQAEQYIRSGDLHEAYDIFESLAADGYVEAYVELGSLLERGDAGIDRDLDKARQWYLKAVDEHNDSYGYIGLARLALNGFSEAGTTKDAIDYLNVAAKADNPVALTILGALYHDGKHVTKNLNRASELYLRAVEHGYALPAVYLSKLNFERHQFIAAARFRIKAICMAYRLAKHDKSDPRLWNYFS